MDRPPAVRLTRYAAGGGCACKVPPGALTEVLEAVAAASRPDPHAPGSAGDDLLVGFAGRDDAAVRRIGGGRAVVATADFFAPVVDDPRDFGRIAAANALSDVYAMGGHPIVSLALLTWPRAVLPDDVLAEVVAGGAEVAAAAGAPISGGHTIDGPEPVYGLAVTGLVEEDRLLRNDRATAGAPLTLTKPLGVGILCALHKATGAPIPEAVAWMTTLNASASRAAVEAGVRAATDVTGFGLLGHLLTMCRASGVGAVLDRAAVPELAGVRAALGAGHCSGGTRRNLDWVRPALTTTAGVTEDDLLVLADAQTSGGLLVVGEIPGSPVIGHLVVGPARITVA